MIGAIEDAILARVQAASDDGTLGYKLETVASYGGEMDEDIAKVVRRFPALWVAFQGETYKWGGGSAYWADARFAIVVAARSYRNERARRRGDGGAPGSFQLLIDARGLLIGQTLGLYVQPLEPVNAGPIFNKTTKGRQASVLGLVLSARYQAIAPEPAAALDDFVTFHADWDLPVHGNVAPPLPAAEPDAADTVTLEQ